MLAYNAHVTADDCADPRGAEHVLQRISVIVKLLEATGVAEACQRIDRLVADLGCPISLAEAGIQKDGQLRQLVSSVNSQRLSNNPRKTNPQALLRLLRGNDKGETLQTHPILKEVKN
ncbi:MAG: iron-containing alcohol dehydrogenase [Pirellulaceae bacterium]